jgi:hypothetical protein
MQAVYYRAPDGAEPVDQFVESLGEPNKQAALDNQIERLNLLRPNDRRSPSPGARSSRGSCGSCVVTTGRRFTG